MKDLTLVSQTKARDLTNGYAVYYESYDAPPNHWEGRIHYECLHYNDTALGLVGPLSVSPSGRLILFNDAIAGTWVLADAAGNRANVGGIGSSFEHFESVVWDEPANKVRVTYSNGSEPLTFEFGALSKNPLQPTRAARPNEERHPAGSGPRG